MTNVIRWNFFLESFKFKLNKLRKFDSCQIHNLLLFNQIWSSSEPMLRNNRNIPILQNIFNDFKRFVVLKLATK